MSAAAAARTPVIVLPGSGCTPTRECNFYAWFSDALDATRYDARTTNMPDPHVCRERAWLPFIVDPSGPLRAGPGCVVVGHSSGAVAAMRLAERTKLKGIILVANYDSDLGDANERASGYFDRAFDYDAMRRNCDFVAAVGGARDALVDIDIQRRVARECLGLSAGTAGAEWLELEARDHFFTPPFRELVELLDRSCDAADAAAAAGAGTTTDEG